MLSMIKSLIQEKTSFMEDANLILENTMPVLDDSIILGESYNDMDYDALIEAGEDTSVDSDDIGDVATEDDASDAGDMEEEPHEEPDGDEVPGGEPDGDEDDIMGQKLDDDTDDATRQPEPIDTDVNNDILTQSIADELPEPIGAQTNEPINDNNDILSMTIDIGSNTPTDILPIPPANAADAVPDDSDDIMNQRVDSGFSTDGMPSDHSAEENGEGADISDDDTGDIDTSNNTEPMGEGVIGTGLKIIGGTVVTFVGGLIAAGIISSKVVKNKYQNKIKAALTTITGNKVKNTKPYLDKFDEYLKNILNKNEDVISKSFYKYESIPSGLKLKKTPKSFFTFKTNSKNNKPSDTTENELLISVDYLAEGLIKKSEIKSIIAKLNKLDNFIKFDFSEDDDMPGDDNGGCWELYKAAGIIEGGPEDYNYSDDLDDNNYDEWIEKQVNAINNSPYKCYILYAFIDAKSFITEIFNKSIQESANYSQLNALTKFLDKYEESGDIGESSEDDINDETLDESVEVLEEKATQEHYAREAFKKKYNFKPLSGDSDVGTIEIDGKTVKIDMKKSKTMTVSGVSQVRQTAANLSDDDTIYLAPEFFKIKNPERRDAVLKHELGHLQMHKKTLEGAKIFDKRFVDKDVIISIILSALGVNKTDLENPIIASIVDASLDYEPISNLLNSKVNDDTFTTIRDGVKKVAEKYIGNNRNTHTNLAELEADRYAANRSSEKALKKGIQNYSRLIYKNSAELIKSLGITDPDLIKQYTKLMHINGADDILRRAKALKDPTLRNASIYKPESYDDPKIDALAKFLEKYDESNDIFNEDYFEEKSHRKLQFDYSVVKDTNSGHSVLLIFDLKGAQVTGTAGDIWDEIGKMMSNDKDSYDASIDARHNTANKNISKYGNLMHTAPGLKLLAIRDMNDNKKLQSVTFKNDEGDFTIKVGDKSPEWLMLTTKVLDVSENGTPLDIAKFMVGTVNRNLRRGHKIDDMELTDDGSNVRFKHPSKKDVKDNPDAYKKEYANDYYDDPFMEDISLGGDDAGSKDAATADVPEATASAGDLSDDVNASADSSNDTSSNEEESPVTAAVKDKVAEADATDVVSTASTTSQQEIMNKLSNITKNLEDVKKSIMSSLQ